jgi:hypothetical protein
MVNRNRAEVLAGLLKGPVVVLDSDCGQDIMQCEGTWILTAFQGFSMSVPEQDSGGILRSFSGCFHLLACRNIRSIPGITLAVVDNRGRRDLYEEDGPVYVLPFELLPVRAFSPTGACG